MAQHGIFYVYVSLLPRVKKVRISVTNAFKHNLYFLYNSVLALHSNPYLYSLLLTNYDEQFLLKCNNV